MSYQTGPGMWVHLDFEVFDAEGEAIQDRTTELEVVMGYGALLPALEERLEGLRAGEQRSIVLQPEQAFGRRNPKAVVEVERSEFPDDVAAGDRFEADDAAGRLLVLQVLEVTEEAVLLDGNHPLAGQRLRFDVRVREVRPATAAELEEAERRLLSAPPTGEDSSLSQLIPPESLLRPPGKR